jgi:hypothetical protein
MYSSTHSLTSSLDGGGWSASRPGRFTPRERAPGTHWIGPITVLNKTYGLDDRGSRVRFPAGAGNFSLRHRVQNGSGAHPASYPMDTRGSFPVGKAAGREADHSPPSRAEVKNA